MCRILQFFVVFVVILHNFDHVNGDKYQCNYDFSSEWCVLWGLNLTRENYEIVPVAYDLNALIVMNLYGTVPVLSAKEICKAMPNLKEFVGNSISLEEILEEAFENCNKLEILQLNNNKIFKIGRNSFKGLSNLEELWIPDGNLQTFDTDLTDLKKLSKLVLNHLNIVNFRAEILREQTNLKKLVLESNNLFDLNIEEIIKNKPNLTKIYLDDNNFKCSRLTEILNLLKTKNINASAIFYEGQVRSYTPNKINEIMCLTDEQWESEFIKLPLEQQLLHNQEMDIRKPKLTSLIIEKVETFTTKVNGQITEITKSLEKINAKIDAQDAINLKIQENMNKLMETLSNILINQSSINNMIDQKIKSLKDELKETV